MGYFEEFSQFRHGGGKVIVCDIAENEKRIKYQQCQDHNAQRLYCIEGAVLDIQVFHETIAQSVTAAGFDVLALVVHRLVPGDTL